MGLVINFRPAVPEDFPAIARITRDSYLAAGYFPSADHRYMLEIQDVAQRAESAQVWVGEAELDAGHHIVAAVTLARHGEPYADIALLDELEMRILVVDPARQRGGIGQAMVRAIIDWAGTLDGVQAISLTTGDAWASAHALYRSMGFVRQEHRDWLVPETEPGVEIWLRVYRFELGGLSVTGR